MTSVYLSLGTNLGDKQKNIAEAIDSIKELIGDVVRQSALYATKPWGFASDNDFVNAAVCVETELTPRELLAATQHIERSLGRTEKSKDGIYHDRIIDIDILLYGKEQVDEPDLRIPHPLMRERDFVMTPLGEIINIATLPPTAPTDKTRIKK